MEKKVTRSLYYFRVSWQKVNDKTLEQLLIEAHSILPHTSDRSFEYSEGQIQGNYISNRKNGFCCQITYCIPDQHVCLVPKPANEKIKETSTKAPPKEYDYVKGEIFFVVKDNHIAICNSGAHLNVVPCYVEKILHTTSQNIEIFSLDPVADIKIVDLLNNEGIKRIELDSTLYEASMDNSQRRTIKKTLFGGISDSLLALFGAEDDLKSIKDRENVTIKLQISYDSRRKNTAMGKKTLLEPAKKMLIQEENSTDGNFSIVTGTGKKIRGNEIKLSRKESFEPRGNSVSHEAAFNALIGYIAELRSKGLLDQ